MCQESSHKTTKRRWKRRWNSEEGKIAKQSEVAKFAFNTRIDMRLKGKCNLAKVPITLITKALVYSIAAI